MITIIVMVLHHILPLAFPCQLFVLLPKDAILAVTDCLHSCYYVVVNDMFKDLLNEIFIGFCDKLLRNYCILFDFSIR